jgi:hypothetical protein
VSAVGVPDVPLRTSGLACPDQSKRTVLSQFGDVAGFMDGVAMLIDLASLELNRRLADGT